MSIAVNTEQDPEEEPHVSYPFPTSRWGRIFYGLFIALMPIFAFWVTDFFKPEWQTGEFSDYIILLLFPEASLLFIVLLAYSIVCYCLLLIDLARYSQKPVVRFGTYTGVLLAFQYSILSGLFFINEANTGWESLYFLVLWVLPIVIPKVYRFLVNRWRATAVNATLVGLAAFLVLISAVMTRSPLFPGVFILAGLTIAAPFWCFLMTLRAALWLLKEYEFKLTLPGGIGLATWIAGYVAAWRFDILKMYELYAALPPQPPPDCYIATAAARGHPQVVGSWIVECAHGEILPVNEQLQILKCAELALMAVQPRLHKRVRRAYDVVGKALAEKMGNAFFADAAYLLLKPWAWLARGILRRIVPEIDSIASKIYMSD